MVTLADEMCERFGLRNGQFFAFNHLKNLQWFLNETFIGFGDLTEDQIINIALKLEDGETFWGFNEHHGTRWQQNHDLMLIITNKDILLFEDIVKEGK